MADTMTMASSSPLADLAENFFLCSVCLEQFQEPKLLPCLHRYCSDCLDKIIRASNEKTFQCPICKRDCDVSKDGVEGFKTDFHMKSMLEFIQLQRSLEDTDLKECASCSKKLKVSAYCFKCRVFLSDQCGQFHRDNIMFKDHKQHILSVENTENMKFMMEKLTSLTQNPRCNHHVEQEALLCCGTCGNTPVCIKCVYGKHKRHDLHDVTEEAERERESLKMKLLDVNQGKDKLYTLPKLIEKSLNTLRENVKHETEKLNFLQKQQVTRIKDKMKQSKVEQQEIVEDINTRREKEMNEIRRKHEEEMKQVTRKYNMEVKKADEKHSQMIQELERRLESLDSQLKELPAEKDEISKQKESELQKISEYCEQLIKRYKNFTAVISSILMSNDKWADVQCIPDIKAAGERLIEEMKEGFQGLESLSDFNIHNLRNTLENAVVIEDKFDSVVDVGVSQTETFYVDSVTSTSDGNVVITGGSPTENSHITVINRDGKVQRQEKIERTVDSSEYLYCCRLSYFQVATICPPYEVGIFDVRHGSYNTKKITAIIPNTWKVKGTRVTTDPVSGHIFFGTEGNEVYVVDNRLNHIKTIQLPDKALYQWHMSFHEGNLLVCSGSKSAYKVTLDELDGHVSCEFIKPDIDGGDWKPFRVCTDKNGFIYHMEDKHFK